MFDITVVIENIDVNRIRFFSRLGTWLDALKTTIFAKTPITMLYDGKAHVEASTSIALAIMNHDVLDKLFMEASSFISISSHFQTQINAKSFC
jgi:hypothetical protein